MNGDNNHHDIHYLDPYIVTPIIFSLNRYSSNPSSSYLIPSHLISSTSLNLFNIKHYRFDRCAASVIIHSQRKQSLQCMRKSIYREKDDIDKTVHDDEM